MSTRRVASQFQTLFDSGVLSALPDPQLLDRFARLGDREAFDALVGRHGPMVMGICHRVLGDAPDADDAFQATFLVLIRRARALRSDVVLAAWLHGVASKVARRARSDRARRTTRERTSMDVEPAVQQVTADFSLKAVVDEEVERLPWKYRVPVALCYLEGLTHEEAARRLEWPIGSVKGRLARAKTLLGSRLARRGVTAGVAAAAVDGLAEAAVSDVSRRALLRAAERIAWGGSWKSVVSDRVVHLTGEVLTSMLITKVKAAAFLVAAVGLTTTGVGFAAREGDEGQPAGRPAVGRGLAVESRRTSIERLLNSPVSCDFSRMPLADAIQSLGNYTGANIAIDPKALVDVGITSRAPVSLKLKDTQLKTVLTLLLRPLQLNYLVEDSVILITNRSDGAGQGLSSKMTESSSAAAAVSPEDRFLDAARRAYLTAYESGTSNSTRIDVFYRTSRRLLDAQQAVAKTEDARTAALGDHRDRMMELVRGVDQHGGAEAPNNAAEARVMLAEAELWLSRGGEAPKEADQPKPGGDQTGDSGGDRNPRSKAILKKLEEPLAMNFPNETPLEDILKYVKQATSSPGDSGLAIYIDPQALQEADRTISSPVALDIDGAPLRRTLQLLLDQLGLVYFVEDGMVVITAAGRDFYGLKPTMAKSTPLDEEVGRAKRGELSNEELNALIEKMKLIQQVSELHHPTAMRPSQPPKTP